MKKKKNDNEKRNNKSNQNEKDTNLISKRIT